jgi:hypothetical protein
VTVIDRSGSIFRSQASFGLRREVALTPKSLIVRLTEGHVVT